ncbi:MAG: hypothetical protein CVV48_01805 [Spirochaetae bacterium HGW-Spirochaetae-4]|jgi:transcriptional regulator with XRE-family HTH domain|nr:MAG: hypothetical protein CVV48_01805 [Spirochaetae bacterium HGW-Spirochaetae-4]
MDTQREKAMDFWGRVELAQKEHGWTLVELCKRAKLNYGTVMNSRSTARLPNLDAAVALSTTLGKSVEWLLIGKNSQLTEYVDLFNKLSMKPELLAIMHELQKATKNELNAINVILGIIS